MGKFTFLVGTASEDDIRQFNSDESRWWVRNQSSGAGWVKADTPLKTSYLVRVYRPDYSPEACGISTQYMLTPTRPVSGQASSVYGWIMDSTQSLACPPFRKGGDTYREYMLARIDGISRYMSMVPVIESDGYCRVNHDLSSSQSYLYNYSPASSLQLEMTESDNGWNLSIRDRKMGTRITDLLKYLVKYFGLPSSEGCQVTWETDLRDTDNIYAISEYSGHVEPQDLHGNFKSNSDFIEGMYIQGVVTVMDADNELYLILRSQPYPVTQELFARIIAPENTITIPENMIIEKPRFINRTIQKVYEMTAKTDSKSNIIQPVFFRVRELANIVVHPAVTENICINLDAYKSQCNSFILKIEGTYFSEIGRTASGIIFNIRGNLLPGEATSGTYYVLDENAELVTSGKYTYES